jgi:hypothetical protein
MEQIKKYIRGNTKRGHEVIAELEKLGGKNILKLKGDEYDKVYYIERYKYTNANTIDFVSEKSFIGQLIVTHPDWEEIESPKHKYPTTYKECCKVLSIEGGRLMFNNSGITQYERELYLNMNKLSNLIICRDAYWKLYVEEMGLEESWKPDYDSGVNKYGIIYMNGVVQESNPTTNWERHLNKVLDFPTEEMRDAFYENFKDLIEECKELL